MRVRVRARLEHHVLPRLEFGGAGHLRARYMISSGQPARNEG